MGGEKNRAAARLWVMHHAPPADDRRRRGTPGSSRARDPQAQADKDSLWRAFLKHDFATEPRPTYPKTNPTDPGRPGFAPTAKKSEEGPKPKRSPRQCSSARPEARERQQAARHAARHHHHRRRDAAEPARVAPRTHGRAHLPNDAQPRPERKPERKPGADAAERPRSANNKRTTMARHPELSDPARPVRRSASGIGGGLVDRAALRSAIVIRSSGLHGANKKT